ncbi:hypothetical protein FIBSPDRAFT_403277 [Athelia psychrophila]|uniref:Uncharacterized protein n=1 Tax=Athelia psychrophila TaxID=1759441 RepID=A0A166NJB9_9AGAM|nr:hypothetical protein FIBSPDRAFT_403277 [Fibularhizoctonia sp. CBS 109695]
MIPINTTGIAPNMINANVAAYEASIRSFASYAFEARLLPRPAPRGSGLGRGFAGDRGRGWGASAGRPRRPSRCWAELKGRHYLAS